MRAIALAAALAMPFVSAQAQRECSDALREAEKSYELGLFEDVPEQLESCFHAGVSRRSQIEAHALMGRAYLFGDQVEKARQEIVTILRLDSSFEDASSPAFAALLAQVRREQQTTLVASVSKSNESLKEAPATVIVITADEIRERGYLDLEELLHDLPGFEFSRSNGILYSYISMRGYRTEDSNRFAARRGGQLLFLVDGVEQNDLSSNSLYLSRQYPLSTIDHIEVVYGPASTMYGANAYTGVISIITKDADQFIGDKKTFSALGQVTGGGYGSGYADVVLAGRNPAGSLAWSLAGSYHKSQERDLSGLPDYDYSYRDVDYADLMRLTGSEAEEFIESGGCDASSPYFICNAAASRVELTSAGIAHVRGLDSSIIREQGLGFEDQATNWSLFGKLRISNLTIGLQTWKSREGTGSSVLARLNGGSDTWTPRHLAFYGKYSLPLERSKFNFFARYIQSSVDRSGTNFHFLRNYSGGVQSLWNLVQSPDAPSAQRVSFGTLSTQLRGEMNLVFETWERLNGVVGVEVAKSSLQSAFDVWDLSPDPEDPDSDLEPEQIEHTDLALYGQGAYRPRPTLKLIFAGRVSYNSIDNRPGAEGYGTLFTPRLGVVYSLPRRDLVLKAIYSEAFKDPADAQKFAVSQFETLTPEKAKNLELSAGWEPSQNLSAEVALYQAYYTDVVAFLEECEESGEPDCSQYRNKDTNRNRGIQVTGRYRYSRFDLWGNYTLNDAWQIDPESEDGEPVVDENGQVVKRIRQADTARNRVNAGVDARWTGRLSSSTRVRWVSRRRTGPGTTEFSSPIDGVDPYMTADAAVRYRFGGSTSLQLIVNNILDKQYFDPTTFPEDGPAQVLQAGRTVWLRLDYRLR